MTSSVCYLIPSFYSRGSQEESYQAVVSSVHRIQILEMLIHVSHNCFGDLVLQVGFYTLLYLDVTIILLV